MKSESSFSWAKVVAAIVWTPLSVMLNGWTTAVLWGWFVAPVFGVTGLTVSSGAGLSLVATYLTHQLSPKGTAEYSCGELVVITVLKAGFVLAFGWCIHACMRGVA